MITPMRAAPGRVNRVVARCPKQSMGAGIATDPHCAGSRPVRCPCRVAPVVTPHPTRAWRCCDVIALRPVLPFGSAAASPVDTTFKLCVTETCVSIPRRLASLTDPRVRSYRQTSGLRLGLTCVTGPCLRSFLRVLGPAVCSGCERKVSRSPESVKPVNRAFCLWIMRISGTIFRPGPILPERRPTGPLP